MSKEKIEDFEVNISNADKIYFPDSEITKGDIIDYYKKISDYMLPYIRDRYVTLHRYPNGIKGESFYQRSAQDYFPDWLKTKEERDAEGNKIDYIILNNAASLVYSANLGSITQHAWLSKTGSSEIPDQMIFDLDPPDENFHGIREVAGNIKDYFEENFGFAPFIKTTGSKGIHMIIPLIKDEKFDPVRRIARNIAQNLSEAFPEKLTVEIRKEKREGKIFVDTARNAFAQSAVCPYSIRARKGAPVATPIDWEELLEKQIDSGSYTIKNIFKRLAQKADPWQNFFSSAKKLESLRDDAK